jgi:SAM-dependent methyltransferase
MDEDMRSYYDKRALEYEEVYRKPERRLDLESLTRWIQRELQAHDVLEIACGTGYWTERIASTARSILATDISDAVMRIARAKQYPRGKVRIVAADAFDLGRVPGAFTAVFAGFFWSHIPRSNIEGFLSSLHGRLGPRKLVVLVDNNCVEGSNHPIVRRDAGGNTYQQRRLSNGKYFEILKNFPSKKELRRRLEPLSESITFLDQKYYWAASYILRSPGPGCEAEAIIEKL